MKQMLFWQKTTFNKQDDLLIRIGPINILLLSSSAFYLRCQGQPGRATVQLQSLLKHRAVKAKESNSNFAFTRVVFFDIGGIGQLFMGKTNLRSINM